MTRLINWRGGAPPVCPVIQTPLAFSIVDSPQLLSHLQSSPHLVIVSVYKPWCYSVVGVIGVFNCFYGLWCICRSFLWPAAPSPSSPTRHSNW